MNMFHKKRFTDKEIIKTQKKVRRFVFLHIVLPILVGGILYLFFCPDVFFVKKVDDILNISRNENVLKESVLGEMIRNYLFDIVWAYSLTNTLLIICGRDRKSKRIAIVIAALMSIGMELLQLMECIGGTFDIVDVLVEIVAVFVAFLAYKYCLEKTNE